MATCAVVLGPSSLVVVAPATPSVPCALYHSFIHRVGVELSCWSIGVASSIGSSKWIPCAVSVPIGPVVIAVAAAVPVVVVGSPVGMRDLELVGWLVDLELLLQWMGVELGQHCWLDASCCA